MIEETILSSKEIYFLAKNLVYEELKLLAIEILCRTGKGNYSLSYYITTTTI